MWSICVELFCCLEVVSLLNFDRRETELCEKKEILCILSAPDKNTCLVYTEKL
jgi:hypothetical protein